MAKWHVESDGGGWWEGEHKHIIQPKTWYITDGWERIDCDSRREAVAKARELNRKVDAFIANEYARNENMSPENPGWL